METRHITNENFKGKKRKKKKGQQKEQKTGAHLPTNETEEAVVLQLDDIGNNVSPNTEFFSPISPIEPVIENGVNHVVENVMDPIPVVENVMDPIPVVENVNEPEIENEVEPGVVLYTVSEYIKTRTDELSLVVGQQIVVEKAPVGGWYFGRLVGGDESGWFPKDATVLVNPQIGEINAAIENQANEVNNNAAENMDGNDVDDHYMIVLNDLCNNSLNDLSTNGTVKNKTDRTRAMSLPSRTANVLKLTNLESIPSESLSNNSLNSFKLNRRHSDVMSSRKDLDQLSFNMAGLEEEERKRQMVILELIKTEDLFVGDLELIVNIVMIPSKRIINEKKFRMIFSNLEDVFINNKNLLRRMEEIRLKNNLIEDIAVIFYPVEETMKPFKEYCDNYAKAMKELTETINSNKAFKTLLDSLGKDLKQLNLSSYLLKPIQRLCKYPLLFKEINKFSANAEIKQFELKLIKDFEYFISNENQEKILEIQKQFSEKIELEKQGRRLIRNDLVNGIKGKYKKQRRLIMFSDCLVYVKKDWREKLHLIWMEDVGSVRVESLDDCVEFKNVLKMQTNGDKISKDREKDKGWRVDLVEISVKDEWIKCFEETFDCKIESANVGKVNSSYGVVSSSLYSMNNPYGNIRATSVNNPSNSFISNNSFSFISKEENKLLIEMEKELKEKDLNLNKTNKELNELKMKYEALKNSFDEMENVNLNEKEQLRNEIEIIEINKENKIKELNEIFKTNLKKKDETISEISKKLTEFEIEINLRNNKIHESNEREIKLLNQLNQMEEDFRIKMQENNELLNKLATITIKNNEMNNQIINLRTSLNDSQEIIKNLENEISESKNRNLDLKKENENLNQNIENFVKDNQSLKDVIESIEKDLRSLEIENDCFKNELNLVKNESDCLKLENEEFKKRNEKVLREMEALNQQLEKLHKENEEVFGKVSVLNQQVENLQRENEMIVEDKEASSRQLENLHKENERLIKEMEDYRIEKEEIIKENEKLLKEREANCQESQRLLQEVKGLNQQINDNETKIKEKENIIKEKEKIITMLENEKNDIDSQRKELKDKCDSLDAELTLLLNENKLLKKENESHLINIESLKNENKSHLINIEHLNSKVSSLSQDNESLTKTVTKLTNKNNELNKELNDLIIRNKRELISLKNQFLKFTNLIKTENEKNFKIINKIKSERSIMKQTNQKLDVKIKELINEKESLLNERDLIVKNKDGQLKALNVELQEKDSIIKEGDHQLNERDCKLKEKNSLLKERDSLLKERDSLLKENDSLLKEKDSLVREKESQLNLITSQLKDITSQLDHKDSQLKENQNHLNKSLSEIEKLYSFITLLKLHQNKIIKFKSKFEILLNEKPNFQNLKIDFNLVNFKNISILDFQSLIKSLLNKIEFIENDLIKIQKFQSDKTLINRRERMEEINSLECEKNNLIKTVESSKQENFILKQNLNNLKEENFNLEIQLKDKNSEIEKLNFESTKEKNEISHLNVKLKDILNSKEKDLLDYQKTIEDYQRTIESLNLKLANEESNNLKKVEELKIQNDLQIKLLENKIHEISESKNRLKKEIQNLQNRVQSLYQKLIIVETENCELIEKLKDLEIKELEMTLVSVSVEQAVQVDNVKIKDMFTQMEYSSLEKSIQSEFFHNNKSVQSDFAFTDKSTQVIPSSTNKYIQADSEIILQSKLYEKAIQVEEISTNLEQTFETFLHKIELFLQLEHSDLTHKDRLNIILEKVERLKNEYIQLELSFKRKSDQFLLLKKSRVNDLQINLKNNPTVNSFLVENKKKRENLSKFVNEAFEKLDSFK